jgi:hypothetical protein
VRIAHEKIAQRVEDNLVLRDEATGNEVMFNPAELDNLLVSLVAMFGESGLDGMPFFPEWAIDYRGGVDVFDDRADAEEKVQFFAEGIVVWRPALRGTWRKPL